MNAAEYERMYRLEDSYWWFVGRLRLVQDLMKSFYGVPNSGDASLNILDIGCGTGAMSQRISPWGNVVSADFSPLALQFSRRRGLSHLIGADAMHLPCGSNKFDTLIAMDMLEHLPDDAAALREFYRVLKPGGKVIATVPANPRLWSEHDDALMHFRRYQKQEVHDRFTEAGFAIDNLSYSMTLLYPVVFLQRKMNANRPHHNPPQAALPHVPAPINSLLTGIITLENHLAAHIHFPFGVTLLCTATKPTT